MNKTPFLTKEKAQEIIKEFPTPFHIYDEKGIRENAEKAGYVAAKTLRKVQRKVGFPDRIR